MSDIDVKKAFGYISPRRRVSQLINSPTAKFELYKPYDCFFVTDPNCFIYDESFSEIKYWYSNYKTSMWGSKRINVASELYGTHRLIFNRPIIIDGQFINWKDEWINNKPVMNELAHLRSYQAFKDVLLPLKLREYYQNQDLLL